MKDGERRKANNAVSLLTIKSDYLSLFRSKAAAAVISPRVMPTLQGRGSFFIAGLYDGRYCLAYIIRITCTAPVSAS